MPPSLPPAPSAAPPPNPDSIRATEFRAEVHSRVRQVTALMEQLPSSQQNAVPDAVLNSAQCLIVGEEAPHAGSRRAAGLMSCRDGERWSPPAFLVLKLTPQAAAESASLLWIVNLKGAQAIRNNSLEDIRFQPGPLVRQSPVLAQTQLAADILSYKYRDGTLSGSAVAIAGARPDRTAEQVFYGHRPGPDPGRPNDGRIAVESQRFVYATASFFNTISPVGILIHHSGLIPIKLAAQLKEQVADMIDEFHARRGFEIICFGRVYHVGYHYLILPNGKVEPGRPERCEGAHARGYNSFIGIALVGDFSPATNPGGLYGPSTPTTAQMRSLIKLCRGLRRRYHIPIQRVMRHSDVTSTFCPGSRFPIQALLRALEKGGAS